MANERWRAIMVFFAWAFLRRVEGFKVCIVGSGMAGASAAHFLRNYSAEYDELQMDIHVYERHSVVGGRMAMVELQGDRFEAGASILHPKNLHAVRFVELLGLKKKSSSDTMFFGIWNGQKFVFKTTKFGKSVPQTIASLINSFQLLWRYGSGLIKMNSFVQRLLERFLNLYEKDRAAYSTVEDLLESVSLYDYTQHPLDAELHREGLNPLLITELVTVISRINYGQDVSLSGLAGAVSLCGSGDGLWAVEGGNWQIAAGLIRHSNCSLNLNETVVSVINKGGTYQVTTSSGVSENYDAVIIATPLDESSIVFDPPVKLVTRYMHHTFATFIRGLLNREYFGLDTEDSVPDLVATLEVPGLAFISISVLKVYNETDKAYKVFSRAALGSNLLDKLFSSRIKTIELDWAAYPEFKAPEKFSPILLDTTGHLYYVNSFENAASTMETSAIAAENVARLLLSRLSGIVTTRQSSSDDKNDELR